MIKFNNPFKTSGNWYKGNLHGHTTNSDGGLSPEDVRKLYHENKYDFLGISDHNKLTLLDELPGMIHIPCEEVDIAVSKNRSVHIVAVNISEGLELTPEQKTKTDPQGVIKMINERGGEAILAHPYWSNLDIDDMLVCKDCIGMEVYNTGCDVIRENGISNVHWDQIIQKNVPMFGFASDDAHYYDTSEEFTSDACGGWTMVRAESLSVDAIFESIKKGQFYASTGPEIKNIVIDDNEIHVETSPVKTIAFRGYDSQGKACYRKDGGLIETASHRINEHTKYIRVQCTDAAGKMAWTNPICFKDDLS